MMMSFRQVRNPTMKNRIMATVMARPSVTERNSFSVPDPATCRALNAKRPSGPKAHKYGYINKFINHVRRTSTSRSDALRLRHAARLQITVN